MKRNMPNGLVIVDNLLLIKSMMKMMIVPLGISKLNTIANNDWSASGGSGANPKTGGERRGSLTCSQVQLLLLRDQRRSQVTSLILIISAIFYNLCNVQAPRGRCLPHVGPRDQKERRGGRVQRKRNIALEKSLEQYFQNDQARQAQGLRKHLLFSFSSTATEVL